MLYEDVLKELSLNKQRRKSGDVIAIPWSLPRLSTVLPGIEQGRYNLISASPKAGKTQLADFLYVYQPVEWIINNSGTDITLKIFYFSLEVSKENKIKSAMCYKLYKDYGILISPQKLSSIFSNYILDDEIEKILGGEEFNSWFTKFNSIVTYYDSIRNPYSIFHLVKSYAEHPSNGTYTYKTISWQNEDKTYTPREVRDRYIPARPNEYVIVLVDHISLLQTSTGETLHQTINKFSSEYCLEMRDKWRYIPTIVQQQSADSSRAQFNYRGDTIIDKIKPDSEGLSDCKYTARDVDLMVSLFYPHRYNIKKYEGIDLERLGDNHREFIINLNRNGISNATIQLLFLGSSSYFEELPRELSEFDYIKYEEIFKKQI
jgi:replicative DNA helicase